VFAAADELARARRPTNPNTFAIANAIDVAVFSSEPPGPEVADVARIPPPRVGFVGVLDTWVDLGLLAATARALPDVRFVIVGPRRVNDQALRALPNVHLLGPRDRRLVPGILRLCSASLVPFVANALTARIVPAKLFEALAAGIVPVCTAFSPNLDAFERQRLVLVARTGPEYVELVRQAIAADTPARRAELAGFGMRQTWRDRWSEMNSILRRFEPPTDAPRAGRGGRGVARAV
jgi:glycosyltransferase involved in cell wall biosynthesis